MKKAYIKPTTLSYNVETEQLLAALSTISLENEDARYDAYAKETGSNFGFDLWADDEE